MSGGGREACLDQRNSPCEFRTTRRGGQIFGPWPAVVSNGEDRPVVKLSHAWCLFVEPAEDAAFVVDFDWRDDRLPLHSNCC